MDQVHLFQRLGLALAIGLLVGLERGWQSREESEGERTAGIRTYALTGLLGGISAALSSLGSPMFLPVALVAFTGGFTLFSWLEATHERNFSVTGVVAGMLTFALGAYAVLGDETVAAAAAVTMTILLALKAPLHSWLRGLTWLEIRAVLILLAMTFLLLPILPDRPIDPWGAVNLATVWKLAILIAGVSFVGYVAVRLLGEKAGIAVTALAGGLTSSTATTLSLARLGKDHAEATPLLAGGILLSGLTMMVRVLVIVGVLNPRLIGDLAPPIVAAAAVLLAASAYFMLGHGKGDAPAPPLTLSNPFDPMAAVKLAALIALIMLLAKIASDQLGAYGVMLVAAISGLADVDAVSLSMARLAPSSLTFPTAATAILIAVASNTIVKAIMTASVGGRKLGVAVGVVSGLAVLALLAVRLSGVTDWLSGVTIPTAV